jgi:hypothetical protein
MFGRAASAALIGFEPATAVVSQSPAIAIDTVKAHESILVISNSFLS